MQTQFRSTNRLSRWFAPPPLTRSRVLFAYAVALVTDGLQLGAGPLGWAFWDQTLDVIAMVLISGALGFHVLFLPTFVLEFLPLTDMLPTWIGCTAAVVMLRKRAQASMDVSSVVQVAPPVLADARVASAQRQSEAAGEGSSPVGDAGRS